ncbi:MAG: hypothetical protein J2P31_10045 [Blastocatellia bacterium]|nr:hypothetical protein [Blastocatellia bacterium]
MTEDVAYQYQLRAPANDEEWRAYHAIRRKVLFENRGLFGIYIENHPDEFAPGNHPMILFHQGEAIVQFVWMSSDTWPSFAGSPFVMIDNDLGTVK